VPWLVKYLATKKRGTLEGAAWILRNAEEPLEVLAAIASVNQIRLQIENMAVRQAREAGHSWQDIADALSVPKQTIHQRYANNAR
jgi:DNA-directed RNA polymerase specialized sigma24 family protein